jgi:crotonobetainyl-CoA:carnitine CoA-transferase CaiB-like acyl-CoA transferase
LNEVGVPCGPVYRMDEVFADPQVQHLGMSQPVEHRALGRLELVRNAARMSGVGSSVRSATPDAGEHADAILAELGLSASEIAELRTRGVV